MWQKEKQQQTNKGEVHKVKINRNVRTKVSANMQSNNVCYEKANQRSYFPVHWILKNIIGNEQNINKDFREHH